MRDRGRPGETGRSTLDGEGKMAPADAAEAHRFLETAKPLGKIGAPPRALSQSQGAHP